MTYILYTNVFVSICAAALVVASRVLLGHEPMVGMLEAHVFFATLTVYNIDRLVDEDDLLHASPRHEWVAEHRRFLWVVTGGGAVGTLATMALLPLHVVLGLAPLAVVTFLYSVPIFGADFRLKSVPGAKTFVIGLVWAVVTVLLPALEVGDAMPWVLLVERFAFIFAITLPFELRDVRRDEAAGVSSLAHLLGARGTIGLGVLLLLGVAVSKQVRVGAWDQTGALVGTLLLVAAAIKPRADIYYSLVLDGTMLLYAAAVLL